MKKKVYVNHVWALDSSSAPTSWLSNFAPASLVSGANTIDEIKFEVKIKTNPSPNSTDWHARLDFFPVGNNPGTWTPSVWNRWLNGDDCYWPVNQPDGPTIHYLEPWRENTGIISITHKPTSNTYYLTNPISIRAGMYAFGTPTGSTMEVELVSVTITYNGFGLGWDAPEDRVYQTGIDRGIFCSPVSGPAVVWNGLKSVEIDHEIKREMTYHQGIPIHNVYTFGSISGTIEAYSTPANFDSYGSQFKLRPGVYLHNQIPKRFNFSYRTRIGDSLTENLGYKLHIVYNALAIPSGHTRKTEDQNPEPMIHKWDITTAPSSISGKPPSSYIVIDSRYVDGDKLALIETLLYGEEGGMEAFIWPLQYVVSILEP